MKIKEIIEKRVSVRTFDESREPDTAVIEDIRQSISNASTPFGDGFTIEFRPQPTRNVNARVAYFRGNFVNLIGSNASIVTGEIGKIHRKDAGQR